MAAIEVERFDHVQINVTDLRAARDFYEGLLGLREVPRPPSFDFPGCFYRIGDVDIHLAQRPDSTERGSRHFCLRVSDSHTAAEALQRAGFQVIWEKRYLFPGIDRFFTRDPSGNRVEFHGPAETGSGAE
jgi:catechol 2,3-dioxygenase-like lactoylglutathione lyase family enzyme